MYMCLIGLWISCPLWFGEGWLEESSRQRCQFPRDDLGRVLPLVVPWDQNVLLPGHACSPPHCSPPQVMPAHLNLCSEQFSSQQPAANQP